jgi:citrate synthase
MSDFKPGLEGIVAVETEIAEPDREGGSLRYRGVDIEELVGHHPYEHVWGLLVDDDLHSQMPDPEPYEPARLTGNAPSDLQGETARLAGEWKLGKLSEISDEQARDDLGRLSAQMMAIVARSARIADGHKDAVPDEVVEQGRTAAEKFLLRWRGEADPRAAKAIDTYWICTAEHGLNASTFTARVVASTGADCGAALSAAVGALSGPLHGGAPAYVKPMLEEVAAMGGDAQRWVDDALANGKRIMGFGHRIYRAEDPRSRILKRTAKELGSPQVELAEQLEGVALAALQKRHPERVLATNVEYYSAVVLDVAEIPPPLAPAMFACSRVAGWSAHILEQKRTGRLFRPTATYIGPASRSLASVS